MAFLSALTANDTLRAIEVATGNAGLLLNRFKAADVLQYVLVQLAFHNKVMNDATSMFASYSNQRSWYYVHTATADGEMQEIGEGGRPEEDFDTYDGLTMGVSVRNFEAATAWTYEALRTMRPDEFRTLLERKTMSDRRFVYRTIVQALVKSTITTKRDIRFDGAPITEYCLANADGRRFPNGLFNKDFGTNHDHLVGYISGAFALADVQAAQTNFGEHYEGVEMAHFISRNEIGRFTAMGASFVPAPPKNTATLSTTVYTMDDPLSYRNMFMDMYTIGRINDVPIIVLNWWPDSYMLTTFAQPPSDPKLKCVRLRGADFPTEVVGSALPSLLDLENPQPGSLGEMRIVMEGDSLYTCRKVQREIGAAIQNPVGAVVTYMGGTSYVEPVIA